MRISPINLKYNQNIQLKKARQHTSQNTPSFGNFESEEVKKLTYEIAIKDYKDCSEQIKKDPCSFYTFTLNSIKKDMDYFEDVSLATVKKWNGSDGKEYAYIALNRAETDKHENKELFDNIAEHAQSYPIEIEEEIIAKDPNFIGIITNDSVLSQIQDKLHEAQIGFVRTPSKNSNSSFKKEEDDLWLEAVSREILN